MRLLLDTHILVWLINGDRRLDAAKREAFSTADSLHVSAVVGFEYAELQRRGRLPVDEPLAELIERFELQASDLPARSWEILPTFPDIHRDPIDRMLVAHALTEGMTILTADANIRRYPVPTI